MKRFLIPLYLQMFSTVLFAALQNVPSDSLLNKNDNETKDPLIHFQDTPATDKKEDKVIPTQIETVTMSKDLDKKLDAKEKRSLNGTLNISQSAYSNWEKGGQNAVAWNVRLEGETGRNGGPFGYRFTGDLHFGQIKQEGEDARNSTDKIDLEGLMIWKLGPIVNPYVGAALLTQFGRGYDFKKTPFEAKSDFWDPAYLTQSLGARLRIKDLNSQFGVGLRESFSSTYTQYTDNSETDYKEKFKMETGLQSKTRLDTPLGEGLRMKSVLELFSTFQDIETVDMRWDTRVTAKFAKYFVITLNVLVNYDKDVLDKIQIKETTEIGLQYEFI